MIASVQVIHERLGSNDRPNEFPRTTEKSAPGSGADTDWEGEHFLEHTKESQEKNEPQI